MKKNIKSEVDSLLPFSPWLYWLTAKQMEDDSICPMRFQTHKQ